MALDKEMKITANVNSKMIVELAISTETTVEAEVENETIVTARSDSKMTVDLATWREIKVEADLGKEVEAWAWAKLSKRAGTSIERMRLQVPTGRKGRLNIDAQKWAGLSIGYDRNPW